MSFHVLGDSGIKVSQVALGCWGLAGGSMWGPQEEADSMATVSAALEAGVNFFDTAEAYGDGYSEELLGRALQGRRDRAVIATKIRQGNLSARSIEAACERSLKRLRTDTIDLYQPHWPDRKTPFEETMQALIRLKEAGKIRAIGLSNFGVGDLSDMLAHGPVVSNQVPYSLLFRAIEFEIQARCVREGIGILCYSALLHGLLTGKYASADDVPAGRGRTRHFSSSRAQTRHGGPGCEAETFTAIAQIRQIAAEIGQPMGLLSIAWVLKQAGVASVIVGARKPEQIRELARAVDLDLDPQIIQKLNSVTEKVKQTLGPNADMWMSDSRFR
jgi:aryl-alcohol dehydrogenase-like predicted oxidoreductase